MATRCTRYCSFCSQRWSFSSTPLASRESSWGQRENNHLGGENEPLGVMVAAPSVTALCHCTTKHWPGPCSSQCHAGTWPGTVMPCKWTKRLSMPFSNSRRSSWFLSIWDCICSSRASSHCSFILSSSSSILEPTTFTSIQLHRGAETP